MFNSLLQCVFKLFKFKKLQQEQQKKSATKKKPNPNNSLHVQGNFHCPLQLHQSKCWTWGLHRANILFTRSMTFLKRGCETFAPTWSSSMKRRNSSWLNRQEICPVPMKHFFWGMTHFQFSEGKPWLSSTTTSLHTCCYKLKGKQICQEFCWTLIFLFPHWFSPYPRWGHLIRSPTLHEKSLAPGTLKPFSFSLLSLQAYSSSHDAVIGTTTKVKGHTRFQRCNLDSWEQDRLNLFEIHSRLSTVSYITFQYK